MPTWREIMAPLKEQIERAKQKLKTTQSAQSSLINVFSEFMQNRGLTTGGQQDNSAAEFFKKQIEQYEADVEKRRQKMLQNAVLNVAAVKGKNVVKRSFSDDALPYMPKKIDWAVIAKQLQEAKRIAATKKTMKQVAAPTKVAPPVSSKTCVAKASVVSPVKDKERESIVPPPANLAPANLPVAPGGTADETPSKNSLSEKSEETAGRLTNIITQIVEDAKNPELAKQQERELKAVTPAELIRWSREEPEKFQRAIDENTKDHLFLCQPTQDEMRAWQSGKPVRQAKFTHAFSLENAAIETKVFCITCRPRHPGYPFTKAKSNT